MPCDLIDGNQSAGSWMATDEGGEDKGKETDNKKDVAIMTFVN